MLLPEEPSAEARETVLALTPPGDRLVFGGRQLYWLPAAGLARTEFDLRTVDKTVGPTTTRTRRTLERMAKKFFAGE